METEIEWTRTRRDDGTTRPGYTFNPWWGCAKVSPGCMHCYADTSSHRWGFDIWGADKSRRMMSDAYWSKPLKWDKDAASMGERRRVFCASMADAMQAQTGDDYRRSITVAARGFADNYMMPEIRAWSVHCYTADAVVSAIRRGEGYSETYETLRDLAQSVVGGHFA